MSAEIAGEKGNFYLDSRWHEANGYAFEINGELTKIDLPKWGNGYTHEIEEVHKCLKEGKSESECNEVKKLAHSLLPFWGLGRCGYGWGCNREDCSPPDLN